MSFSRRSLAEMADIYLIKLEPDYKGYKIAPPFGVLYLASALEKEGFTVKLYHERGTPENMRYIIDEILKRKPLFVGISTLTGLSLTPSIIVSKRIKRKSNIPVIWGGLHPTMLPEQTLNNENIDLVVLGEGEVTIVELTKALAEKGLEPDTLKDIKGIGYRENGHIKINPTRPIITNLDRYSPAWHLLDIEKYFYKGSYFYSHLGSSVSDYKIAGIITSRGCPGRCGYCYNQFVNKRTFRAHSAKKVIRDIESLRINYNVSAIVFEDDCLFTDKNRAIEIIREIQMPWSASIRAMYLARWGEEFIKELKTYNCVELRIGAESGSQRILDIMQKDIKVEDIYRSAELCLKYNISVLMGFMCGIPGETWSDMLKTFQLIDDLERMGATVASGPALFCPYPGTPLYDLAKEKGFEPPQKIEDWAVNWDWGPRQPPLPFIDRRAKFVGYYRTIAKKDVSSIRFPFFINILRTLAKKRWEKRFFRFPLDYYIPRFFLKLLESLGLRRITHSIYD